MDTAAAAAAAAVQLRDIGTPALMTGLSLASDAVMSAVYLLSSSVRAGLWKCVGWMVDIKQTYRVA